MRVKNADNFGNTEQVYALSDRPCIRAPSAVHPRFVRASVRVSSGCASVFLQTCSGGEAEHPELGAGVGAESDDLGVGVAGRRGVVRLRRRRCVPLIWRLIEAGGPQ
eukprot:6185707-Pleurochrysis_carterae.AAC.1